MSLRDFPQELVSHIITFLTLQHARLAPYAGISSTWQHAVEAHTFSRLNILTADLDDFHQHIAASNASTHRRAALRVVEFTPSFQRTPTMYVRASRLTPTARETPPRSLTQSPVCSARWHYVTT